MVCVSSIAISQPMNDLGMMGESGVVCSPTVGITPASHIRLDLTQMNLLGSHSERMNSIGIATGLSSNIEFIVKFQMLKPAASITPSVIGFGGKFILPMNLPFIYHAGIWAEGSSSGDVTTASALLPTSVTRGAFVVQPDILQKVNGNIILGVSSVDNAQRFFTGCNGSYIVNELLKAAGEVQYNYYSRNDVQGSLVFLVRATSGLCVQVSPGYVHAPGISSWMISFGVSATSAGIYFVNSPEAKNKDNEIPSFDEMQKQLQEEKKEK
jgi:hypothetical protein